MKKCNKCLKFKEVTEFHKDSQKKSGLRPRCKICTNLKIAEWQKNNIEKKIQNNKKWKESNGDKIKQQRTIYYELNKDMINKKGSEYRKKNLVKSRIYRAKYRAKKTLASLNYTQYKSKIEEIYNECPYGYEVDHIVPLQGKNVCGLHVPWNLQYLTPSENRRKNNRL